MFQLIQAHKKKANYAALIAVTALPKKLYCLALRLPDEYYSSSSHGPTKKRYFTLKSLKP